MKKSQPGSPPMVGTPPHPRPSPSGTPTSGVNVPANPQRLTPSGSGKPFGPAPSTGMREPALPVRGEGTTRRPAGPSRVAPMRGSMPVRMARG
jgi:hypothetical protein